MALKVYEIGGKKLTFEIETYAHNPVALAIRMNGEVISKNFGYHFIGKNTIQPANCAWIDTNNHPGIEDTLRALGAEPYMRWGSPAVMEGDFYDYPLWQFPVELLKEMDESGWNLHQRTHGKAFRLIQHNMNLAMFGEDPTWTDEDEKEYADYTLYA